MKINNIEIKNFRGFAEKHFDLDSRMNVVLGNNTSGKTTLLHAIQIALGAYLQALMLIPKGKYYSRNFKKNDYVKKYSETTKSFFPELLKPEICVNADIEIGKYHIKEGRITNINSNINWLRDSVKNSSQNTGELLEVVEKLEKTRRDADSTGVNSILPIMLSFGATRLENNYNAAEKTKVRASREANAYKCALDEQVNFKAAFDWIYSYEKNILKELEFDGTNEAFINSIILAIPAIKQVHIDHKNKELTAQIQMTGDEKPKWLTYDMMSDGFKAMINIVAEISYRCIQLNGFLGDKAVKETPGIVLIDELDLYLHPHWQQHILADLQNAFPKLQFIVSTHSPFIVQSVESRNVITLDGYKGDSNPNMRSIEDIVVTEMNMSTARSPRYTMMLQKAEEYYQLVKAGKEKTKEGVEIKVALDEIEAQFSDDPAYVALLKAERNSK